MSLFATKPIDKIIAESEEHGEHTLKRSLGALSLTMLGVGAIIGTGIFVLTGQAAAKHAGPAVVISMILAGVVSALAALCYSEFASTVPISGSAYAYGYATLGEFIAWIIGWDLILEYAFGAATVAVGWSGYFIRFLSSIGIHFPISLGAAPGTKFVNVSQETAAQLNALIVDGKPFSIAYGWNPLNDSLQHAITQAGLSGLPTETAFFNLPAFLIAVFVTALLVKGIKESASFNNVIVIVKVIVVVLFIVAGIGYINPANFTPFIPEPLGSGVFGYSGILTGAAVIFFAYVGFDAVSTAAQEAKNPQRRYAARDYRLADNLHDSIRSGRRRDGRSGFLHAAKCSRADWRGDYRRCRTGARHAVRHDFQSLSDDYQCRRGFGIEFDDGRNGDGTAAHFLFDGQRRLAAGLGGENSSEISHAVCDDDYHRHNRGDYGGFGQRQHFRRISQHRHAVRVRHRFARRDYYALDESEFDAPVQSSAVAIYSGRLGGRQRVSNERFAARYMDAPDRLDVHRSARLFRLRLQPQQSGESQSGTDRRKKHLGHGCLQAADLAANRDYCGNRADDLDVPV